MVADPYCRLHSAGRQLSDSVDRLTGHVVAVGGDRRRSAELADRYREFAGRVAGEYPSLAAPAERLSTLFVDLDVALARMAAGTEELIAAGGRLADLVAEG